MDSREKAKLFIYAGFGLLLLFFPLSALEVEPVHTFYYIFAWWPLIFLIDGIIYVIREESLIINRPREFFIMLPWSAFIWFIFEIINVRLQNWQYMYVPSSNYLRWTGYFLSYATVLPAIFEISELLETLNIFKNAKIRPLKISNRLLSSLLYTGIISAALIYFFPKYFFWLTWGTFIFLLEPVNYRLGLNSFLKEFARGKIRKFYLLLASGLICGIIWEVLNYWAGAKWVYTVPFVGEFFKICEMPILGFLGFPPFAIECYAVYSFISYLRRGKNHELDSFANLKIPPRPILNIFAYVILIAVCALAIFLIDKYTVHLYTLKL